MIKTDLEQSAYHIVEIFRLQVNPQKQQIILPQNFCNIRYS